MGQDNFENSQVGEIAPLYKNNGTIDDVLNNPISKVTCDPVGRQPRNSRHDGGGLQGATAGTTAASTRTLAGLVAFIVGAIVGG